jgi:hypothetical protein
MLAPGSAHFRHDGRHPSDHQRPRDDDHAGGKQRADVSRGAGDEENQPEGAAGYPQHGYAPRPGGDTRRAELPREPDHASLPVELAFQFSQPPLFFPLT